MNIIQVVFFILITLIATAIAGAVTVVSAWKPKGDPLWEGHTQVQTSTMSPPVTFMATWLAVELPLLLIMVIISRTFTPYG